MSNVEIICAQARIIEKLTEINQRASDLLKTTLSLLGQHQSVDAEENLLEEIGGAQ